MNPWETKLALHQMRSGVVRLTFAPDEAQRAEAAAQLGLVSLPALTASVTATPWLDGVELSGAFEAVVEQICGVTLEAFSSAVTEVTGDASRRVMRRQYCGCRGSRRAPRHCGTPGVILRLLAHLSPVRNSSAGPGTRCSVSTGGAISRVRSTFLF